MHINHGSLDCNLICDNELERGAVRNQSNRGVCCTLYAARYFNRCTSNTGSLDCKTDNNEIERDAVMNQSNRGVCCTLYAPRYFNRCTSNTGSLMVLSNLPQESLKTCLLHTTLYIHIPNMYISVYLCIFIYYVAPRPNSSSSCARPSLRMRIPSSVFV